MVPTPQQKGDALENAVRGIENLLLSLSPSLQQETHKIESKKIISVGDVHLEIDVFISVDLGSGYKSVFIFECKNWKDAVGKNEVIVFSEKVGVCQAQWGCIVAKSFTSGAENQAKNSISSWITTENSFRRAMQNLRRTPACAYI
jgi:hypothetical protein